MIKGRLLASLSPYYALVISLDWRGRPTPRKRSPCYPIIWNHFDIKYALMNLSHSFFLFYY